MMIYAASKVYLVYFSMMNGIVVGIMMMEVIRCVDEYLVEVVNMRVSYVSWVMLLVVMMISTCVIMSSIDYLSVFDSGVFMMYMIVFQMVMYMFVISNDMIISLIG